ncbi:hypothetical protein [uncultured Thiodictyon sp.]|uniref:hypothetical protein n=1 Tax=uncultured Thiodictyon sp. TaxID=1846217 RepID=UPI0025FE7701|nr:hypothetical protein [uncultured Thiodictyon sp.]
MNGNPGKVAATAAILLALASAAVQAEGGAAPAELMQKMDLMEQMELTDRMDMEEQLDLAKTCAEKDQFDCSAAGLAKAAALSQTGADQGRIAAARGFVQQQRDRHAQALRLAEQERARRADLEAQLTAAADCTARDEFDCARSSLARARELTQGSAEQDRYTRTRGDVQERMDRYNQAAELAEQRRTQLQAQLAAARTCVDKHDWDCAVASLKTAHGLTQGPADEGHYNQVRAYVAQVAQAAVKQEEERQAAARQEERQAVARQAASGSGGRYSSAGPSPVSGGVPSAMPQDRYGPAYQAR